MVAVYILLSFRSSFFCWLTITPFLLEDAKLRIMIEKQIHCERNYSEKFYRGFSRVYSAPCSIGKYGKYKSLMLIPFVLHPIKMSFTRNMLLEKVIASS